jgi:uncharacterized protein (UPF0332 family)
MVQHLKNFEVKSEENYQVAKLAHQNNAYNVAVSRIYYSIYQKILYVLSIEKIKGLIEVIEEEVKNELKTSKETAGEHQIHIKIIDKYVKESKEFKNDMFKIKQLEVFRRLRNRADYSVEMIEEREYSSAEKMYEQIKPVLDKIIKHNLK